MGQNRLWAILWVVMAVVGLIMGNDAVMTIGVVCSQVWAAGIYFTSNQRNQK